MKRKAALSALLALVVAAPAVIAPIVAPSLAPNVQAQDANVAAAEYPDVPLDHWAYNAINKLSQAGIIEGYPSGQYNGGRAMTRYEFAVAIARLLDRIPVLNEQGEMVPGPAGTNGVDGTAGAVGPQGPAGEIPDVSGFVRRPELLDAIAALRAEFRTELAALGARVDDLDARVTALENRVVRAPRLTITPSLLHRTGVANYIDNDNEVVNGRDGTGVVNGGGNGLGEFDDGGLDDDRSAGAQKFSYTDFELRLTDRVSDTLSLNAALRSISGTIEDPWLLSDDEGTTAQGIRDGFNLREANAVLDLGNRAGTNGLTLILGRQRTKIDQGLLYDNDLSPTDQLHGMFNLGPFEVGAFIGSNNNNNFYGNRNAYTQTAAVEYLGANNLAGNGFGSADEGGSFVGFPDAEEGRFDDNEAAATAAVNLFRIAGQPIRLRGTYLFDGVGDQEGYGAGLTVPLFNRNVGFEYIKQSEYFNGDDSNGSAYNITLPVLRMSKIDLDLAYGRASDDFEYFIASSANPFARTYGEAIFDRPNALGAPLINGGDDDGREFMAAKKVFDVRGTLRFIRRVPLELRYYTAEGTDDVDLGHVFSVGTTVSLTRGVDLELKYGRYSPEDTEDIEYFRVGANVGF